MESGAKKYSVQAPELDWEGSAPYSKKYDDIYYPKDFGPEAAIHVFLNPNNIPQRWAENSERFVIGEIGFGTGLNLYVTIDEWIKRHQKSGWLHYISCEHTPLREEDILHSMSPWPRLKELAEIFLTKYPPPLRGFHRLIFDEWQTSVTLLYGDAAESLMQLRGKIDAWYLDGFAPKNNESLWSDNIVEQIARLSNKGTTFGTYAAAGAVRRRFEASGFEVSKFDGFRKKRESLRGTFTLNSHVSSLTKPQKVTVVGGGIAGASLTEAFTRRGCEVTLLERESRIADRASGNPAAVLLPYITKERKVPSRLYLSGYQHTLRHYDYEQTGIVHFASTKRLEDLLASFGTLDFPESVAHTLDKESLHKYVKPSQQDAAFYYPQGGWLDPRTLCQKMIEPAERIQLQKEAHRLATQDDGTWKVFDQGNNEITQSDIVILANAYYAKEISESNWLPIEPVRGQLIEVASTEHSRQIQSILCYNGYFLPEREGKHLLGTSFDHFNMSEEIDDEDSLKIRENIDTWVPNLGLKEVKDGRVSFRTSTYDRIPFVGALPDKERASEESIEMLPDLYTAVGFGSRGMISAPLSAELLASQICGDPLPLETDIAEALAPERYIKRMIRKGEWVVQ